MEITLKFIKTDAIYTLKIIITVNCMAFFKEKFVVGHCLQALKSTAERILVFIKFTVIMK